MKLANILFTLLFTITFTPAYAYLDPGTGSLVTSIIIGGVATLLYVFRGWFYGIKNRNKKK